MGKVSRSVLVAHFPFTIVVPPVTPPVPALPKVNQNEREQCTRSPGTAIERTRRTCLRRSSSFDRRRASHAPVPALPKGRTNTQEIFIAR